MRIEVAKPNTGMATDVIFKLPTITNSMSLADEGTVGNGISRLSDVTFETKVFANSETKWSSQLRPTWTIASRAGLDAGAG